jgi:hypothetical protein
MAIKPSPRFATLLLLFHALVALVVFLTGVSTAVKSVMFLLVLLSLSYYLARDVLLLLPDSWCDVSLGQEGDATVTMRCGHGFTGRIANNTAVSPHFIVLRVGVEGRWPAPSRVIFPDAMSDGAFRELCVRLKYV